MNYIIIKSGNLCVFLITAQLLDTIDDITFTRIKTLSNMFDTVKGKSLEDFIPICE